MTQGWDRARSTQHGRGRQRRRGPWWEEWGGEWTGKRRAGPRMRRGDIRRALMGALEDGPAHGYELINRLEEKSGGVWRPSPGSVYPTLQLLEDEGLVRSEERDARRVYELTEAGRAVAAEQEPNDEYPGPGRHMGMLRMHLAGEKLGPTVAPLVLATRQVMMTGDDTQVERGLEVLRRATKELYQILAEG